MNHNHSDLTPMAVCGSLGSFVGGLYGMAVDTPSATVLAYLGTIGSIAVPILVTWLRARSERRFVAVEVELKLSREREMATFLELADSLATIKELTRGVVRRPAEFVAMNDKLRDVEGQP